MSLSALQIPKVLQAYVQEGIPINIEGLKDVSRSALISAGYEATGDPEDHELLEKYYPIGNEKGINFKIYLLSGEIWSSGVDFYGFDLKEVLEQTKAQKKIRLFMEKDLRDGALIIGDHIVCRFTVKSQKPRALTFETDLSISESMGGRDIATNAVVRSFDEVDLQEPLKDKRLAKLRKLILETRSG